jgi:hypothetical protein
MPFYGDSSAGFRPAAGFGNTVWHQGVGPVGAVAVETSPAPWPPQQFIQQIPAPNQLDELRYHTQYGAATPYHPQPGKYSGDNGSVKRKRQRDNSDNFLGTERIAGRKIYDSYSR